MTNATIEPVHDLTMEELLAIYPGAKRTLFQLHHIGGCSSCGFSTNETFAEVCARYGGLDPATVMEEIREGHLKDAALLISPEELQERIHDPSLKLLDIRTREEFEAVAINGSRLMTQETMQEAMNWPKVTEIILIDHTGTRGLDAAAYFAGHGFTKVKAVKGGIDAYSEKADPTLPRYTTEMA